MGGIVAKKKVNYHRPVEKNRDLDEFSEEKVE